MSTQYEGLLLYYVLLPSVIKILFVVLGDRLQFQNGMQFTTVDKDNDKLNTNCAVRHKGSWWYKSCFACDLSNDTRPFWANVISKPVMMIRKI